MSLDDNSAGWPALDYHPGVRTRVASLPLCVALLPLACASPKTANEEPAQSVQDASKPVSASEPESELSTPAPGDGGGGGSADFAEKKPELDQPSNTNSPRDDVKASKSKLGELQVAVPAVGGGLGRDIIRRKVSDHLDEVRDCYGRGLEASADLGGALVIHVEIDGDGRVTETSLGEQNAVVNRQVQDCVLELVEGWSFDAPRGGDESSADLSFSF